MKCHFSGRSDHVGTFQWPFTCPTQRDLVTLWRLVGSPRFPAAPRLLFIFLVILHFVCFRRNLEARVVLQAICWQFDCVARYVSVDQPLLFKNSTGVSTIVSFPLAGPFISLF